MVRLIITIRAQFAISFPTTVEFSSRTAISNPSDDLQNNVANRSSREVISQNLIRFLYDFYETQKFFFFFFQLKTNFLASINYQILSKIFPVDFHGYCEVCTEHRLQIVWVHSILFILSEANWHRASKDHSFFLFKRKHTECIYE